MNSVIETILKRGSLRKYKQEKVSDKDLNIILKCAMRAPTAGNMMTYSILTIRDEETKRKLSLSCDNQPFIEGSSVILVFLADYNKWYKYYEINKTKEFMESKGGTFEGPTESSLLLAMQDAVIAAQNAVIAAESLGIGSCYIGDIMENVEYHKDLFKLPDYVSPVTMLTLGYYPDNYTPSLKSRFKSEYVVFDESYKELSDDEINDMYEERNKLYTEKNKFGAENYAQTHYNFKVKSKFSMEMTRSIKLTIKEWSGKKI